MRRNPRFKRPPGTSKRALFAAGPHEGTTLAEDLYLSSTLTESSDAETNLAEKPVSEDEVSPSKYQGRAQEAEIKSWLTRERKLLKSEIEKALQDKVQIPRAIWMQSLEKMLDRIHEQELEAREKGWKTLDHVAHDQLLLLFMFLHPHDRPQDFEMREDTVRAILKERVKYRREQGLPQIRFRASLNPEDPDLRAQIDQMKKTHC